MDLETSSIAQGMCRAGRRASRRGWAGRVTARPVRLPSPATHAAPAFGVPHRVVRAASALRPVRRTVKGAAIPFQDPIDTRSARERPPAPNAHGAHPDRNDTECK